MLSFFKVRFPNKYVDYVLRMKALERKGSLNLPGLLDEIKAETKELVRSASSQPEPSTEDPFELDEW